MERTSVLFFSLFERENLSRQSINHPSDNKARVTLGNDDDALVRIIMLLR